MKQTTITVNTHVIFSHEIEEEKKPKQKTPQNINGIDLRGPEQACLHMEIQHMIKVPVQTGKKDGLFN